MKKFIAMLGLALLSQQSMAATVAGIDFLDIAETVDASTGTYITNFQSGATIVDSVADANGATYIYSNDGTATVDLSFGGVFDVADVDLSILFVGDGGHFGTITLLGGSSNGSSMGFSIADGENYTGFNSEQGSVLYGIFSDTLDLDSLFSGTFSGVRLDIGGASAVPSLVGTVQGASVVPVPAAVWLFGSGLLGLVGVARRKRS